MSNNKAETFGWDTAYGILVSTVNKALASAAAGTLPEKFSQDTTDAGGDAITISGSFQDWSIASGGSGLNLHMQSSIASLSFKDNTTPSRSQTFTNGQIVLQVNLGFVDAAAPGGSATGTFQHLKFKKVVSIVSSEFSESAYTGNYKSDTENAIKAWLNANPNTFNHVFAAVNLNRKAASGAFSWLLPTASSYAYVEKDTLDDSVFGILSMTEGRTAPSEAQISQFIVPDGTEAGFLISKERFMSDMLLPTMPVAFPGTTKGDFAIQQNGTEIALTNKDVQIAPQSPPINKPMQDSGTTYPVYLEDFTLQVQPTQMIISSTSKTNILDQICGMGEANNDMYPTDSHSDQEPIAVWSYCATETTFNIELYTLGNGKKSLKFNQLSAKKPKTWTQESEGMKILGYILDVIGVLLVIVIGVLTDGAGFVIAGMIVGLLVGLANQIPSLIGIIGQDDAPSIDQLAFNATDPFVWPEVNFALTHADLNDSLQLGGLSGRDGVNCSMPG